MSSHHRPEGIHIHRRVDFGVGTAANRMVWERHRPRAIPLEHLADPSLYSPWSAIGIRTLTATAMRPQ